MIIIARSLKSMMGWTVPPQVPPAWVYRRHISKLVYSIQQQRQFNLLLLRYRMVKWASSARAALTSSQATGIAAVMTLLFPLWRSTEIAIIGLWRVMDMVAIANEIKGPASSIQSRVLDTVKSSVVEELKDWFDAKSIPGNDLVDRIHRSKAVRQKMARQISKPALFRIGNSSITALGQHLKTCTALPNRLCRFENLPVAIWRHAKNNTELANSSTTADALKRLERAVDALGISYAQSTVSFSQRSVSIPLSIAKN